jgi:hypothetical protein
MEGFDQFRGAGCEYTKACDWLISGDEPFKPFRVIAGLIPPTLRVDSEFE